MEVTQHFELATLPTHDVVKSILTFKMTSLCMDDVAFVKVDNAFFIFTPDTQGGS